MQADSSAAKSQARLTGPALWLYPVSVALMARAARSYRPFPSIDDFAYVPLAWAANDPSLFPTDTILRQFILHAPLWRLLVAGFERTVGLATGFWLLTLLLTVFTVAGAFRLLRAAGVAGFLLPLLLMVGFFGRVNGLGRGAYDGALGDAFHVQWLALALVLWAADALVRQRPLRAGAWLGLAALSHPLVALHGTLVLAVAALCAGPGRVRRLSGLAAACLVVGAPVILPLARSMLSAPALSRTTVHEVITQAYLFRAPSHYTLTEVPIAAALVLLLTVGAGALGALLLARTVPGPAARTLSGLLLGQGLLAVAMVACYGPWLPEAWRTASLAPYLLDLTRTTPLLVVLGAVPAVAAIEVRLAGRGDPAVPTWIWAALYVTLATLLALAQWRALDVASLALALAAALLWRTPAAVVSRAALLGVAAIAALVAVTRRDVRAESVPAEQAELYAWARSATPAAALFIVPPAEERFRFYAKRGVYVDYKLFPVSTPSAAVLWRQRLDLVAAPDQRAQESPGWDGAVFWDRSYANRNVPSRIADLLAQTGADYFVWDRAGLAIPPHVPVPRPDDARLVQAFANRRFTVYRLAANGHATH